MLAVLVSVVVAQMVVTGERCKLSDSEGHSSGGRNETNIGKMYQRGQLEILVRGVYGRRVPALVLGLGEQLLKLLRRPVV